MAMTYQEYLDKAILQARIGLDPRIFIDPLIAESLTPQVFQDVARNAAKDPDKRSLLRRAKTVTFVSGAATLTDDVLTQYMEDSALTDTTSLTKTYSWEREWVDFIRAPRVERRLGYYNVQGGTSLYVIEPGALYVQGSGISASRQLVVPCVPAVPATATTAIDAVDEITSDLVDALAEVLRGQVEQEKAA
jgi:hypothetical protein